MSALTIRDGDGIGSATMVNSSKAQNFIKSVSRRPVDASGLPTIEEFYSGKIIIYHCKKSVSTFLLTLA